MRQRKQEEEDVDLTNVLGAVEEFDKDLFAAFAKAIDDGDIKSLVDIYYGIQRLRIAIGNKISAIDRGASKGQARIQKYFLRSVEAIELQAAKAMAVWAKTDPVCQWAMAQKGISVIYAVGLAGYIDITKAPTAGAIWRFAGLDPSVVWIGRKKAQKLCCTLEDKYASAKEAIPEASELTHVKPESIERFALQYGDGRITWDSLGKAMARCPWNARLKTLCWKIGESFNKCYKLPDCYYGQLLAERKAKEIAKNLRGDYAVEAKKCLEQKNIKKKDVVALLKQGRLPAGAIHARAKRWTVKLFLSHWHDKAYREHFKKAPPKPYPIAYLGHAHMIEPPEGGAS